MSDIDFFTAFEALTEKTPFPWQSALYELFVADKIPSSCNIPTGLGKTSVIAIWLIAMANRPDKMPRRLVYVVNRRTVVDQTTEEVENYRRRLPCISTLFQRLIELSHNESAIPYQFQPLALSTLRGQFADNREWSIDPARPAIICGTVDMIGSRLLFSGYGIGFKQRPLHAGFLGQDALLVHDEAHLEPAFQDLIVAIEEEQRRCTELGRFRVMELTATSRGRGEAFELSPADEQNAEIKRRVEARKKVELHILKDEKKLADQLAELALAHRDSGKAVLIFTRTVDDVLKIRDKLAKEKFLVETLTGTMRGRERDLLVERPGFKRFLPAPPADAATGTVFLVCTSAGEVGVNISADHLVCDLSTFESMAQRFGRVNRFGKSDDTRIDIVHPVVFDADKVYETRRERTLTLMRCLEGDGNSAALNRLPREGREAAFAPPPTVLPVTDILFDAWTMTTIRERLPGRPPVEPYLHGLAEWQPPETHVAWREEVGHLTDEMLEQYPPKDLLEEYALKPHELLREPSYRAFRHFEAMAKRLRDLSVPVWLLDDDGKVEPITLEELADKDAKDRIEGRTVILPPKAGGLNLQGMLDGSQDGREGLDVADTVDRKRVWNDGATPLGMRKILTIRFPGPKDDEDTEGEAWHWCEKANEGGKSAPEQVLWQIHVDDVVTRAKSILSDLSLPEEVKQAVIVAAQFHDHGKRRKLFQTVLGNFDPNLPLAKSGRRGGRIAETYRHEFGSLLDVESEQDFRSLSAEMRELVLHLIATHHGRARPHFATVEAFDPERPPADVEAIATLVPQRFARLQRKYGRWGLAYLESLLRAADWAASANPSKFVEEAKA